MIPLFAKTLRKEKIGDCQLNMNSLNIKDANWFNNGPQCSETGHISSQSKQHLKSYEQN